MPEVKWPHVVFYHCRPAAVFAAQGGREL